jgi:hypothetical protein
MQMTQGSKIKRINMGWTYDFSEEEKKCVLNVSEETMWECGHFEN